MAAPTIVGTTLFSAQDTLNFFKEASQMGLDDRTLPEVAKQGLVEIADLVEHNEDDLDNIWDSLRKPPQRLDDKGKLHNVAPFPISAKTQKRMLIATHAARYYDQIGRDITPMMLYWTTLKNFDLQHQALLDKKKRDEPDVPKLTSKMSIVKWIESFKLHCYAIIGVRNCPIYYVIRNVADVSGIVRPPLLPNQPHSAEYGSIEGELIHLSSHDHPLFQQDNTNVYDRMEIGLRGSAYAATMVKYRKKRDGVGAMTALVSQHAGKSVWEKRIKTAEDYIQSRKWTGTSSVTLEAHLDMHRSSLVALEEASEHVAHQIPEERTRVTYVLNSIECKDPEVLSAVSAIRQNDPGMRDNFESAAYFLQPTCPVARRGGGKSRNVTADIAALNPKLETGKGSTGVELRWHPRKQFHQLSQEQKQELKQWCATNPRSATNGGIDALNADKADGDGNNGRKSGGKRGTGKQSNKNLNKKLKRTIASAIKKQLGKATETENEQDKLANGLVSMIQAATQANAGGNTNKQVTVGSTTASENPQDDLKAQAKVVAGQLQGILKSPRTSNNRKKGGRKSDADTP